MMTFIKHDNKLIFTLSTDNQKCVICDKEISKTALLRDPISDIDKEYSLLLNGFVVGTDRAKEISLILIKKFFEKDYLCPFCEQAMTWKVKSFFDVGIGSYPMKFRTNNEINLLISQYLLDRLKTVTKKMECK